LNDKQTSNNKIVLTLASNQLQKFRFLPGVLTSGVTATFMTVEEENELKTDPPSIIGPAPPSLDLPEMVPLHPRRKRTFQPPLFPPKFIENAEAIRKADVENHHSSTRIEGCLLMI